MIGDEYLVIIKKRKKAIVRLDGKVIFNNLKNNDSYGQWHKQFKEDHSEEKFERLKHHRIREIENIYIERKQPRRTRQHRELAAQT